MSETDEAGANLKAERMYQDEFEAGRGNVAPAFHWICSGHKCHAVAEKSFMLFASTLSSIVSTLLVVQTSQQLERLRAGMTKVLRSKLRILPCSPLSAAATHYRRNTLTLYTPPARHPKKRAAIITMAILLNGDWRNRQEIQHMCNDQCCASREVTINRVVATLTGGTISEAWESTPDLQAKGGCTAG